MYELGDQRAEFLLSTDLRAPQQQEKSVADKFRAEAELLGSLPSNIGNGIAKSALDAWDNKTRSGIEFGAGLGLGAAFTLLSRNPNSVVRFTTTWMTRGFITATALDLTGRVVQPMAAVWKDPTTLEKQKIKLGDDLGDAALNYGLGIAGGLAGAKMTEKFVAPTKLGSWLQGFKETTVSATELGAMVPKAAGADSAGGLKSSFAGKSPDDIVPKMELPSGKVKLREMQDGSKIGSMSDGSVVVMTTDGTTMYFKNNSSMFGLKRNLELKQVVHADGAHADLAAASLQAASRPNGFAGRDPSAYLDGGARAASASEPFPLQNGTRISTDSAGSIRSLQTETANVVRTQKGDWEFKANSSSTDAIGLELKVQAFSLKSTTDWLLGYRRGAQIGVVSKLLDTMSELGSGIVQHEIIQKIPAKSADGVKDPRSAN